ncbi:MAG: factor for cell wall maintenance or synthesis YoaR [Clostridiales bacterium]|nr:factor for cell wall maintenance or synthesis YoaR [Clostridiales bacterium]
MNKKIFKIHYLRNILLLICILFILTGCGDKQTNDISYNVENQNYENNATSYTNEIELPKQEVASFYTNIYDKTENRMNNLRVAANNLSNTVIKSGEIFSFNETMGPSNKEKGYKEAKIFDAEGNVIEGYGGGICQISSTLYNAALELNLEIIERHAHSRKVQYVEEGKDAAISYNRLDLKFKNSLDYDLTIECKVDENKVYISLLGNRK